MDARKFGVALLALCPVAALAQEPVEEYADLLREIRVLEQYNELRERQIEQQQEAVVRLQTAFEAVPDLELQLPPLLIRMVDDLRAWVELDFPLLVERRTDTVNNLYAMIEDASINDIAKLRRILEAWSIEVEYGREFQTFPGKMPIGNPDRDVDFVAIGRVGLLYQTQDDEGLAGAWDSRTNSWVELGTEHRNAVRQAIRMARNQIAPELVLLPTIPPQPD